MDIDAKPNSLEEHIKPLLAEVATGYLHSNKKMGKLYRGCQYEALKALGLHNIGATATGEYESK